MVVLAGLTIVVVWLMLMEVVGVDDILKELPPVTSAAIMTMAAVPSAIPLAIAQPWPRDRPSFIGCSSSDDERSDGRRSRAESKASGARYRVPTVADLK